MAEAKYQAALDVLQQRARADEPYRPGASKVSATRHTYDPATAPRSVVFADLKHAIGAGHHEKALRLAEALQKRADAWVASAISAQVTLGETNEALRQAKARADAAEAREVEARRNAA